MNEFENRKREVSLEEIMEADRAARAFAAALKMKG